MKSASCPLSQPCHRQLIAEFTDLRRLEECFPDISYCLVGTKSQVFPKKIEGSPNSTQPCAYLIFVIFFTQAKFLENKIYTEKKRKLRQNTQKIVNFLGYYGKIHSKLPIFRVKSVKIYTAQKYLHENSHGFRDKYEV